MSIHNFANAIVTGSSGQGGGVVEQSLKFNDDDSSSLTRIYDADGNRKTWTWSAWVKRGNLGTAQRMWGMINGSSQEENIRFETSDKIRWYCHNSGGSAADNDLTTVAVFRDVSAWYHIQIVKDTTESTAANRNKLYVNGVLQDWAGTNYATLNYDGWINSAGSDNVHRIGAHAYGGTTAVVDGYMSDVHFIDGQALAPTSFGETINGYWAKKDYSGSYGANGFKLHFRDDVVSEGFNTVTYRGTASYQSISGLGFEPDLVWLKGRNTTGVHGLWDSIRGANYLRSDATDTEVASATNGLQTFDGDGFTVGPVGTWNGSGNSYIGWCWDAGSGSPVSNTDGSITSTLKANPSYGFSIVSYAGSLSATGTATVGHGLSSAPEMIIFKGRDTASNWWTYHTSLTNQNYLVKLNSTDAEADKSSNGSMSAPTSTVFDTNYTGGINTTGDNHIAYCFAAVAGYSSFGSFVGNGGSNPQTIGFEPAFVLLKRSSNASSWQLFDNTRGGKSSLNPNISNAEATNANFEFLSDGFDDNGWVSDSGETVIWMAFADTREAAFWKDVSGNNNNWTPINLDYRDSVIDSPANNFATLNTLDNYNTGATLSEGNLKWTIGAADGASRSTYVMTAGKWYVEFLSNNDYIGVVSGNANITNMNGTQTIFYAQDGTKRVNGSSTSYGVSYSNGDIIGIALDLDASPQTVTFYKNNSSQGSLNLTDVGNEGYSVSCGSGSGSTNATANFGQDSTFAGSTTAGGNTDDNGIGDFAYAPPSGYLALCTANLPEPTIIDGSENFTPYIYTADNTSPKSRTGIGFTPDFLWFKDRTTAFSNGLYDTVRGPNKQLQTNNTSAENTYTLLDSFDADGFTTTLDGTAGNVLNYSTDNYVTWSWKAGGTPTATNSAGAGNVPTSGSVMINGVASTSSLAGTIAADKISANTTAGFSIISYTGNGLSGQTVAHGLSSAPEFIVHKDRGTNSNNGQWNAWHKYAGDGDDYGYLSVTNAFTGDAQIIPNGTDTIELKANLTTTNQSNHNFIMYAWHSVEGYNKVGSYIGNGNADGPFIYTGFRPAWIMIKNTASGENWQIHDSGRDPDNVVTQRLYANTSGTDVTSTFMDFVSNGVKCKNYSGGFNSSGATFIYLAFAESPFKYSTAR